MSERPGGFDPPAEVTTFGLNDCGRWCSRVDHLVVIDAPGRFKGGRKEAIAGTTCGHFWNLEPDWLSVRRDAGHDDGSKNMTVVEWREWDRNLEAGPIPGILTSLIPTLVLAYRLGFRDLGVIGCDMVRHAELSDRAPEANRVLRHLRGMLMDAGVRDVVNLSEMSGRLAALPRVKLDSWLKQDL